MNRSHPDLLAAMASAVLLTACLQGIPTCSDTAAAEFRRLEHYGGLELQPQPHVYGACNATFATSDDPDAVLEAYRVELEASGYTIRNVSSTPMVGEGETIVGQAVGLEAERVLLRLRLRGGIRRPGGHLQRVRRRPRGAVMALPPVDTLAGREGPVENPAFSATYRPAGTRAKVAIALLGVTGLIALVTALHSFAGFGLLQSAELGTLTDAEATGYDAQALALGILYLLSYGATAIAFLAWLSRSIDNVPTLIGEYPAFTPRWSIGWWFVPVFNLWRPYQVVKDLNGRLATAARSGGNGLILAWWVVWLAVAIAGTALLRLATPETIEQLRTMFTLTAAINAVDVVAASLAILVIRQIQARADERAASIPAPITPADSPAPARSGGPSQGIPPCPRCGAPREAGRQICSACGLDLWEAYDRGQLNP